MKIKEIPGESNTGAHKGEFELISFSHGMSQPTAATRSTAGGGTTARADHQDVSVSKYVDIGTPDLNQFCVEGTPLTEVIITMCRSEKDKVVDFLQYTLKDCIISSISIGGGGDELPAETLSLNYGSVKWNYIPQKEGGGGKEGNKTSGWDVIQNKKV